MAYTFPQRQRARKFYTLFNAFNVLGFNILTGQASYLIPLSLGASPAWIGLLSSLNFLAFLVIPFGQKTIRRWGIIGNQGKCWFLRYTVLLPLPFLLIFASSLSPSLFLGLFMLMYTLFHFARGLGMASNSPMVTDISSGKDRGRYLARVQTIANLAGLTAGVIGIFLIRNGTNLFISYAFLSVLGLLMGFGSLIPLYRISEPEPIEIRLKKNTLNEILGKEDYRSFFSAFSSVLIVSSMIRPFMIVFIKKGLNMSDTSVFWFALAAGIGSMTVSLLSSQILDRLGAKPLLVICTLITFISVGIMFFIPFLRQEKFLFLFLGLWFFLVELSLIGMELCGQTYLYNVIYQDKKPQLGTFLMMMRGVAGITGSLLGGIFLNIGHFFFPGNSPLPFYLFFGFILIFILLCFVLANRMKRRPGDYSVIGALSSIFSVKDIKAIYFSNRLGKSVTIEEEQKLVSLLKKQSRSPIAREELIKKLRSPDLLIRQQALLSLEYSLLTDKMKKILCEQVEKGEFDTAFMAARILGDMNIPEGIPPLRKALSSEDYMLVSYAMISLSKLKDRESLEPIRAVLEKSSNPTILIYGLNALRVFKDRSSLPALLRLLHRCNNNKGDRKIFFSTLFTLSYFFNCKKEFYRFFSLYNDSPEAALEELQEQIIMIPQLEQSRLDLERIREKDFRDRFGEILSAFPDLAENFKQASQIFREEAFPDFYIFLLILALKKYFDSPAERPSFLLKSPAAMMKTN